MSSSGRYTPATRINNHPNLFGLFALIAGLWFMPARGGIVYGQTPSDLPSAKIAFGLPNQ